MRTAEASFLRKTSLLARKDLRIESRGRDTLPPMVAFSIAVTLLLAFTLPGSGGIGPPPPPSAGLVPLTDVLAGFLWVTVLFAGLIGFARTFEVEHQEGAIDPLLLVPLDRSGLFLAKAAANLTFLALVEVMLLPLFGVLFGVELLPRLAGLALVVLLVDIGFIAVGTLFAAVAAQTRSKELMLPLLALPALVPLFIAAVELTATLFAGNGFAEAAASGWFGILIGFDLVFGILGAITFEFVLD